MWGARARVREENKGKAGQTKISSASFVRGTDRARARGLSSARVRARLHRVYTYRRDGFCRCEERDSRTVTSELASTRWNIGANFLSLERTYSFGGLPGAEAELAPAPPRVDDLALLPMGTAELYTCRGVGGNLPSSLPFELGERRWVWYEDGTRTDAGVVGESRLG